MEWRKSISIAAVIALLLLQIGLSSAAPHNAHADDLFPTPTYTPTPVNGHCTDYLCG